MVQKGKFYAAIPFLVSALNRVDLPTLGRPTMPQLKPMIMSVWFCSWFVLKKKGGYSTPEWAYALADCLDQGSRLFRSGLKAV